MTKDYLQNEYDKLDYTIKEELKKQLEVELTRHNLEAESFNKRVYDMPTKAPNEFQLFCRDQNKIIRNALGQEKVDLLSFMKKAKELFDNIPEEKLNEYKKQKEELVKDFKSKMKEFNKMGYYTKRDKNEENSGKRTKKRASHIQRDKRRREAQERKKQLELQQSQVKSNANSQHENTVFILININ